MNVLVYTRTPFDGCVSLDELLSKSDFISLHCPLTDKNANLINEDTIAKMKNGVVIINTARGGLVDEHALYNGITSKKIAYYATDVLREEPPKNGNVLIGLNNVIITPHVAWATTEARQRLIDTTYNNVKSYIEGNPINFVNK